MSYEEIIKDTNEMTRRMMLKWDIISAVLILFAVILFVLAVRLLWKEHRERKARKLQETYTGFEYKPTVTDTVQVIGGVEYHKMGVPGRG